jgi:hypothetical protein
LLTLRQSPEEIEQAENEPSSGSIVTAALPKENSEEMHLALTA